MKKFELPYNFEDDFIDELSKHKEYFEYIKFVYMPAYDEEYIQNTREEVLKNNDNYKRYSNYINVIKKFQSLNLDVCILFQRNVSLKLIEKYINELNIKYFVMNDDKLVISLRKKYKDKIYISLSITRKLTVNDILTQDLSMYDELVLMFWYNRHLDTIKKLPNKYKYAVLTNAFCDWNCQNYKKHWWDGATFIKENLCTANRKNTIKILPNDLIYFDKYITSFKLVDRAWHTDQIIREYIRYCKSYENINNVQFDKNREDHYNLNDESEFKPL